MGLGEALSWKRGEGGQQVNTTIEEGLEFILGHLEEPILWPRTISVRSTEGGQILVNGKQEALTWYKAANLLDCRISAYAKYTDYYINETGIAPSLLLADIDKSQFKTAELFELASAKTCLNFTEILGSRPTQLWTGGGYHYIQPQLAIVLEKIEDFKKFDQPSRRFLQFEEQLLTENKGDENHYRTVSFRNCMLRIPGSLNSKRIQFNGRGEIIGEIPPEAEVRIIRRWDGNKPSIKPLLTPYYVWLQDAAIKDIQRRRRAEQKSRKYHRRPGDKKTIGWIENLLDKPLDNFRKYCIWRVFAPYFINVKGLSRLETFNTTMSWLEKCNSVYRLDFNPKQKIDAALDRVGNYHPISRDKLKEENNLLYVRLEEEGIIQ
jgi:hypothetical protein